MRKILVAIVALVAFAPTAFAGPANETRRDQVTSSQKHDYWLSNGLNKLVFWKPPSGEHDETRRQ